MVSKQINYTEGYKYKTDRLVVLDVPELGRVEIVTDWCSIKDGLLYIQEGYCWDGPSGPALDTKSFMRPSLGHDALYQLHREGHLPLELRYLSDLCMYRWCREDGMWWWRAWRCWWAVDLFAAQAASNKREVKTAP